MKLHQHLHAAPTNRRTAHRQRTPPPSATRWFLDEAAGGEGGEDEELLLKVTTQKRYKKPTTPNCGRRVCNTKEVYCAERKFTSQLGANSGLELPCDQFHTKGDSVCAHRVCAAGATAAHDDDDARCAVAGSSQGLLWGVLAYWFCIGR